MRAALIQLCAGDDPAENLPRTETLVREAFARGASLIATPECTNMVTFSRTLQQERLRTEREDATLARLRILADELGIWLLIGSLCLKADDGEDARHINRSFVIGTDGRIVARYDKIHMFDADLGKGEAYRESAAYRPGARAVIADTDAGRIGLSICYDLRFPHLYRDLAKAGAEILAIPAAFTVPTGRAHWHVLNRARAIETGSYVLAPAQSGTHAASRGQTRVTYGHSIAVGPWGEIIADAGEAENTVTLVDIDPDAVGRARSRIPAIAHDRPYSGPELSRRRGET